EISSQLGLHPRIIDRYRGRENQRVPVSLLPKAVDHRSHESQNATGALKLEQGGPVGVEPVEDLGVDRIGRLDALLVLSTPAVRRKLGRLGVIQFGEGAGGYVSLLEGIWP